LASFFRPSWRRFSSRRIFFLKFFSFIMGVSPVPQATQKLTFKLMTIYA
jgi:hypothetical protein